MVDYIKALNSGIYAAEVAERARVEIDSVISEAAAQIESATCGALKLALTQEKKHVVRNLPQKKSSPWDLKPIRLNRYLGVDDDAFETISYTALSLSGGDGTKKIILCTWVAGKEGYPVKLQFSGKEITCRDKHSLQGGIVELLSDSETGGAMKILLSQNSIEIPPTAEPLNFEDGEPL